MNWEKEVSMDDIRIIEGYTCNESELEQLLNLMREIKETQLSGEVFEMDNVFYYIEPDAHKRFYVAVIAGIIVGYVYGTIESPICGCLYYLGVKREFRRKGVGRLLVEKLIQQFKNVGVQYIYALSTNKRMTDFSSSLGFKKGETMIYMKKEFSKNG